MKLRTMRWPDGSGFFGMKLHAVQVFVLQNGREADAVCPTSRRRRIFGRIEAVGEIYVRPVARALRAAANRACVRGRSNPSAGRAPSVNRRMLPGKIPRPRSDGASSLDSNSACRPRQIPRNGIACAEAFKQGFAKAALVERAHHLTEMPDARQNDFRRGLQDRRASEKIW